MAQREIMKFLLENKSKRFTTKELSKEIGVLPKSISASVKKLIQSKMIKSKLEKENNFKKRIHWV